LTIQDKYWEDLRYNISRAGLKSQIPASEAIIDFLAIPKLFYEAALETTLALELVEGKHEIQHVP
jgi:hypothetical protein